MKQDEHSCMNMSYHNVGYVKSCKQEKDACMLPIDLALYHSNLRS